MGTISNSKGCVQLENICLSLMQQVAAGKLPSMTVDSESAWDSFQESAEALNDTLDSSKDSQTSIDFGRKQSKSNFALTLRVMQQSHEMLRTSSQSKKTNVRSFYYDLQQEELANLTMNKVNNAVTNVQKLLGCTRWDLGFVATSKGLLAGDLTLNFNEKSITYCSSRGDLIPQEISQLTSVRTSASCLVVIEKDTIFQKLLGCEDKCTDYNDCILITGKGEPDIATRVLVHRLSEVEKLPTYILVDNDPYGFEIMCTYRFGSKDYKQWASPSARWIGVHPEEVIGIGINAIALTEVELKKLKSLKERTDIRLVKDLRKQMRKMKKTGKCEIETIANISNNFLTYYYIHDKIKSGEYY